ncbi:hypothetical protein KUE79_002153 [Listeria monocytogenes]|nr:hypothetical protein [Listeria monocytogenes]
MNLRKTPSNKRNIYIYKFAHGTSVKLEAGKDGVTEIDIQELHRFDDREVYNNVKNLHPARTAEEKKKIADWKKSFISDFKKQYGYEPSDDVVRDAVRNEFPMNYALSINAFDDECEEGKNPIQMLAFLRNDDSDDADSRIERLRDVVKLLSPKKQELYHQIQDLQISQKEVALKQQVTPQYINKQWRNIKKKIKKLF